VHIYIAYIKTDPAPSPEVHLAEQLVASCLIITLNIAKLIPRYVVAQVD
jgi:hypothetical protein